MLCDLCHKREGTTYLVDVRAGREAGRHLCERCFDEWKIDFGTKDVPGTGWTSYSPEIVGADET